MKTIFNHLLQRAHALMIVRLQLLNTEQQILNTLLIDPTNQAQYDRQLEAVQLQIIDNRDQVCDLLRRAKDRCPGSLTKEHSSLGSLLSSIVKKSLAAYQQNIELRYYIGLTQVEHSETTPFESQLVD